ncbi:MAG: hypothetical protein HY548_07815 [Elusimicrobia bacterium]|nr:hypothetical protein [Elusimicrobiota bacterium]
MKTCCGSDSVVGKTVESFPWRLRVDGPLSGEENMRHDHDLLEAQRDQAALPTLRFFRWKQPTLSYGRLQNHEQAAERAKLYQAREIVRRPTGGGMVRHDGDLSLSLAWRRGHPFLPKCLKNIYRAIHQTVQAALQERGVETALFVSAARSTPAEGICFVEPAEDDLMVAHRKVMGGALRVTGWGCLYQGNILVDVLNVTCDGLMKDLSERFARERFFCPPEKI